MKTNKKSYAPDVFLVGAMLLIGLFIIAFLFLNRQSGNMIQIRVAGQVTAEYSLNQEGEYEIEGIAGTNLLVIRDGKAWMEYGDCPDQLCVHMGPISQNGQSIVCLPNQVVVTVTDESQNGEIDIHVG